MHQFKTNFEFARGTNMAVVILDGCKERNSRIRIIKSARPTRGGSAKRSPFLFAPHQLCSPRGVHINIGLRCVYSRVWVINQKGLSACRFQPKPCYASALNGIKMCFLLITTVITISYSNMLYSRNNDFFLNNVTQKWSILLTRLNFMFLTH